MRADAPIAPPLVVRFGAIGDLVLLTPLLHLLHRRYGQPCRLLGSGGWMKPLLAGNPDLQDIISVRSRRKPYLLEPTQWRAVAALRAKPPGPVYVCDEHAQDKVRWLLARAGIAPGQCVYVTDMPRPWDKHWVDLWLRFGALTPPDFRSLHIPEHVELDSKFPRLFVNDDDRADLAQWLQLRGLQDKSLILLQPGNKRTLKRGRLGQYGDDKTWPIDRWAMLAQALASRVPNAKVILCGAPPEAGLLYEIQAASRVADVEVAAEDLPLRRLLALLEAAVAMVSVDTGPAHMAATVDCPLVVLYGDASPESWVPRSASGSDVLALGGPPISQRVRDIALFDVLQAFDRLRLRPGGA